MFVTIKYIVIGVVTVAVLAVLNRLFKKSRPLELTETSGKIRPARWIAWCAVIVGALMLFGAIYGFATEELNWRWTLFAGLMGAAIGGFMLPSLTSRHEINWDFDEISGPSKQFGPGLGLQRATLQWADIVKTGKTITDYWFIETQGGERIYWSFIYSGYGALTLALEKHCPELELPHDLK